MSVIEIPGKGGLRRLLLTHPAGSSAEIYLHGAHVTSWIPAGGAEWLFISGAARFGEFQTIRGGIPVIFPQFAERGSLPKHGFARQQTWRRIDGTDAMARADDGERRADDEPGADDVTDKTARADGEAHCRAILELTDSAATRSRWPHRFRARVTVELGSDVLAVTLDVHNTDDRPFDFTAALHSYFRVEDIGRVAVAGLQGCVYLDKPADMQQRAQAEDRISVAGETDRVYPDAPAEVRLMDDVAGRELIVAKDGFHDIVVWNPWQEITSDLPDMTPGDYRHMLCIEAAQAVTPIELEPGEGWRGSQTLIQSR
ncbi:D-hexose-6-phosphate mutarotase [soil metagenome]